MAFWGLVVKPGKPAFYSGNKAQGKLKITKATLGTSNISTRKTYLRCKVMDTENGFNLCSFLPNKNETCSLNLVFGETDCIMFSVIGHSSISVHLTGYHMCEQPLDEEYDIENSVNKEDDSSENEDDHYGGSFIDDSDASVVATSPRPAAGRGRSRLNFGMDDDDLLGVTGFINEDFV